MATAAQAGRVAKRAANSEWADRWARLGFCARGTIYLVVGVIAIQIAQRGAGGADEASASKDGALREIAERPFGRLLLFVLAAGLAGYALWRGAEALWGKRDEDDERKRTAKRLLSGGKALLYLVFFGSTLRFLSKGPAAGGRAGDRQEETLTARILDLPAGQLLVGGAGAALIGGSAYVIYRGLTQEFADRLDTSEMGRAVGRVVDVVGTVGLAARGLVFGVIGFLLVKAAIDFDPEAANGIDGTLKLIARQPYGRVLLMVTAVGLIAYGLYSFAEARYREL